MARSGSPGDLQDFWKEFEDIESSKKENDEEEETTKTPDEGELEAQWLQEAGYGFLVSRYQDGKELTDDEIHALTDSLPRNHAAVVKKRVDTLNATLRKKQKYTTKIDVLNIFPQQRIAEPVVIHSQLVEEPDEPTKPMSHASSMVQSQTFDLSHSVPCDPNPHSSHRENPCLHQQPAAALFCSGFRVHVSENSRFSSAHFSYNTCLSPVTLKDSSNIGPAAYSAVEQQVLFSDDDEQDLNEMLEGLQISRSDGPESDSVLISRCDSNESDSVLTSHSRSKSSSCNTLDSLDSGLDSTSSNLNKDQSSSRDSLDYLDSPSFTTPELKSNTNRDTPLIRNIPVCSEAVLANIEQTPIRNVQSNANVVVANSGQAQLSRQGLVPSFPCPDFAYKDEVYSSAVTDKKSEKVSKRLGQPSYQSNQGLLLGKSTSPERESVLQIAQGATEKPIGPQIHNQFALQSGQDLSDACRHGGHEYPKQFEFQCGHDLVEKPKSPENTNHFSKIPSLPLHGGSRKRKRKQTKAPKSPASPRNEVIHPEFGSRPTRGSTKPPGGPFAKNKGGYSMSGVTEEVHDNAEMGVEMLSLQQQGKRNSQLSPISDADIEFTFSLEENGKDVNGHTSSWPTAAADNMPNFTLIKDPLGVTRIEDISDADLQYVRKQALLELTHMFDKHNLNYSRRRTKKKYKENGIFGVPLQTLLESDQKRVPNPHTVHVPIVFSEVIKYLVKNCLDTEGILRIPGSSSRVKQLRDELEEKFYTGTFIWNEDLTANDVAALMKQFLRELPVPLLTDEYINAFAQVESLEDRKQQLHALNLLVLLLPNVHRDTLHCLLSFLEMIIEHSSSNRMSLHNVAMIMAPNLFMAPKVRNSNPVGGKDQTRAWEVEMKMAAGTSSIMKMMIKYRPILWTIPTYLISLVRRQYELEQLRRNKDKPRMKFLSKKDKTEVYKQPNIKHETDFREGVVRVQAPLLTKSSTAIQLDPNMTAGDIVAKFRVIQGSQTLDPRRLSQSLKSNTNQPQVFADPRNFHSAGEDTFLFEKGGNIGERCLHNDTNMMALYKVNPNAEWIIKHRASSQSFR